MQMKNYAKIFVSFALAAALLLSMGNAAFAEEKKTLTGKNTDNSQPLVGGTDAETDKDDVPIENVGFGYGIPDPQRVDRHELGGEDVTIEGVSYDVWLEPKDIYIHQADLVAAKFIRECREDIEKAGVDIEKLYIKQGLIYTGEEGLSSKEQREINITVAELQKAAGIKLQVGDMFDVGNGADTKLRLVVSGFIAPSGEKQTQKDEVYIIVGDIEVNIPSNR